MHENANALWSRAALLAISMTALGRAVEIHGGELGSSPYPAIAWLTIAILIAGVTLLVPKPLPVGPRGFKIIVTLCVLANFAQLATKPPDFYLHIRSFAELAPFNVGLLIAALLCGRVLAGEGRPRVVSFAAFLLIVGLLGSWIIMRSSDPNIDVFVFQRDSPADLLQGHNPYAADFPNIYPPDMKVYGEGVVSNGRLQFGYPYLPQSLLATLPASVLGVDVRYTQLAAILLSAVLLVITERGVLGFSAAILLATTPFIFLVLEKSWIEPLSILMLALTVACIARWPKFLPVALGLFLASKQYTLIAAVLIFVRARPFRQTTILLVQAALVALLVGLPLAVWNFKAFWWSAIVLQFRQPFRLDALSYLAWVGEVFWPKRAIVVIPFAAFLASAALVLWRRKSIGFATAVAFCFLMFFAFNKQAFANYYFFVIGAMACGIVELTAEREIAVA